MSSSRRILLFTGDGKGKTTAALGMVLRTAGHGLRACVIQFIKNDPCTGERASLSRLAGVEFTQAGRGFVPKKDHPEYTLHRQAAQAGLNLAKKRFEENACDLMVLDEICNACATGLLAAEEVVGLLEEAPPGVTIVMTGRDAPQSLIDIADTVTVMECRKHGYEQKIGTQKGIEY